MRKHPILGYNRCIEVLIAAPSGTPIMASGSGTVTRLDGVEVEVIVKIKHNSTYETIYAHMKAAKGIREGKK